MQLLFLFFHEKHFLSFHCLFIMSKPPPIKICLPSLKSQQSHASKALTVIWPTVIPDVLPTDPAGSSSQVVNVEQLTRVTLGLGVTPRSPGRSADGTSGPTASMPLFFPGLPTSVPSPAAIKSPQDQVTLVSAISLRLW
jgi:hypothetical protein